jgi:hypothetical protein
LVYKLSGIALVVPKFLRVVELLFPCRLQYGELFCASVVLTMPIIATVVRMIVKSEFFFITGYFCFKNVYASYGEGYLFTITPKGDFFE